VSYGPSHILPKVWGCLACRATDVMDRTVPWQSISIFSRKSDWLGHRYEDLVRAVNTPGPTRHSANTCIFTACQGPCHGPSLYLILVTKVLVKPHTYLPIPRTLPTPISCTQHPQVYHTYCSLTFNFHPEVKLADIVNFSLVLLC